MTNKKSIQPTFVFETINGISFEPIKVNSNTDIAYDIKAKLISEKTGKPIKSVTIKAGESINIKSGFAIIQPDIVKVPIMQEDNLANYLSDLSSYFEQRIALTEARFRNQSTIKFDGLEQPKLDNYIKQQQYIELIPSAEILSRSGLGFKSSIIAFNGQIDNLFNTEIGIKLFNHSNKDFTINFGERVAQLEMKLVWSANVKSVEVEDITKIEATRGGFGSTGV